MRPELFSFISGVQPFTHLPETERMEICGALTEIHVSAGTILFVQGKSDVDKLMLIHSGALELFYKRREEIILRDFLRTGDTFGGISILMNESAALRTVRATSDSIIYTLPRPIFLDLCEKYSEFKQFFLDAIDRRLKNEAYASLIAAGKAFDFLSGVAPFSFLPDEELENACYDLSIVRYSKGRILFIQSQSRVDYLHVFRDGAAEQYILSNNQKTVRGILGEGDIFGGISMLLNNGIAIRTLEITEDSFCYLLHKKHFHDLCSRFPAFSEFFTDTFGKRMLDRSYAATVAQTYQCQDETFQTFTQTIGNICSRDLVFCTVDTSILAASRIMTEKNCSSILVKNSNGEFCGLLTDNDLRRKVIAANRSLDEPVSDIMSSPLEGISAQALIFEALMLMNEKDIKHLSVLSGDGRVIGVVTNRDLLLAQGQSPFFLITEIKRAVTVGEVAEKQKQLTRSVQSLIKGGAKSENITRLITAVSDVVLEKLVIAAIRELGPPPAPFSFMILGSDGRKEQTLKTDQDNAIIFEDPEDPEDGRAEDISGYFLKLGERVCDWLDQSGYAYCRGDVMARNPKWCQPLSVWKSYFREWIDHAEPIDLLKSSIFFDFRHGYGDSRLVNALREFLFESLLGWAGFFRRMTENALHFKPPIGFFRNFVVESKGEHRNQFDIKSAMVPIVDMARIYALKYKIEETNTRERLHQVYLRKKLSWTDYNELQQAYSFLMQVRLVRQVTAVIEEGGEPDNYINPKKLSRIEQTMLKEIFQRIEKFQGALGLDFTGIA